MTGSYMRFGSSKAAAFCTALAALAAASVARADDAPSLPTFALSGDSLLVRTKDGETAVKVGCVSRSFASVGTTAYVLCDSSIIAVVDADPEPHVVVRRPVAARIEALFVSHGVVTAVGDGGVLPLDDYWSSKRRFGARATEPDRPRRRRRGVHEPEDDGMEASLVGTTGPGFDGPTGAFAVFDAALAYRFDAPFIVAAYGTFGAATGAFDDGDRTTGPRGGDVQVAVGEAVVGIDSYWVNVSFGGGAGLFSQAYQVEPIVVTRGRIGAIDDVAFTWHLSFGFNGPVLLGVLGGTLEFHVAHRFWLGTEAELGNLRYGRFMVDLRYRLHGEGPRHVVDLRLGLGLAYVQSSAVCDTAFDSNTDSDTECIGTNVDDLGPAAALGIVWRP